MDTFTLLKFTHFVGFMLIFAGTLAIFISEWHTFTTQDVGTFAEAARYTLVFRNTMIAPGSIVIIITGIWLVLHLDLGFFETPWLVGMWGLFLFEFIEANLIARPHNRRTLRCAREALESGTLTPEVRAAAHDALGIFMHFFDVPITLVMLYCGVARPETWTEILIAVAIAVLVAALMSLTIPGLHQRTAAGTQTP